MKLRGFVRMAGMRQLRPGMKYWPAWFDIFPNSELLPRIEAPVCILHVRLAQCAQPEPLGLAGLLVGILPHNPLAHAPWPRYPPCAPPQYPQPEVGAS